MTLDFHPRARSEAQEAYDYYDEREPAVADRFLAALDKVVERLMARPLSFPAFEHGTRRAVLVNFPYQVVYRIKTDALQVIAVAHTSREPEYWRGRILTS